MAQSVFGSGVYRNNLLRRVSWGGIFAGVVVVLVTHIMLSLLGIAFGAGSINPMQEQSPLAGLGTGSAIWIAVSTIIALFAGGWVAARMAAVPDRTESTLHGVVTWGLASLAGIYFVTSAALGIISGAAGIVGKTASLVGQGAKAVAPQVAEAVGNELPDIDVSWNEVKGEVNKLLAQTGDSKLQPKNIERQAKVTERDARATAERGATDPQSADSQLSALWKRVEGRGNRIIEAADRTDLENILVARTNMSREKAAATVDGWEKTLANAQAKIAELKAQAEAKAKEVAQATADTVSKAAAWSFVALLIGLIAGAAGGYFGGPRSVNRETKRIDPLLESEGVAA